ncbi:penicillin acylase family protein [Kribbella capetownensis]|uniref:Penicillin acylase family protein n=1 Tax=Kribbella capetownensis TaxID=1572659 RepID=A0A4R0IV66_9ACTN|nr:penicillin acylase family protein [Kribbella capetownensis]TCC36700.1 penicillin acylase family protein [Kribbella capetownensis]
MRRLLRVLVISGIALATVLLVIAGTVVFVVRHSFPTYDGTIELDGLDAEVEVVRDAQGIPQIYADSPSDLFAAQGYVAAQDRFFEMDFRRHVTAGRLSELFGESALETDKFIRTLGWRRVAEKELGRLDPSTRQYLDDYARGVNSYLSKHSGSGLSLEYAVLSLKGTDYRPEPWTAADSLAWLKAMAWDLGGNMDDEITKTKLLASFPAQNVESLYPDYPFDRNQPILSTGAVGRDGQFTTAPVDSELRRGMLTKDLLKSLDTVDKVAKGLPQLLGQGDGIGSNSWVVSGDHTTTGKPLLANDPHLGATMPGIWTQVGLHCNNLGRACPYDVSGFSFSGLPGVVIGHNNAISWGFTNLDPDVQDLYLERVDGNKVLYNKRWSAMATREETFKVAGEDEPVKITVRETRHGPLISDVGDDEREIGEIVAKRGKQPQAYAVSLQWTALTPGRTADALFAINRAQNWTQFRAAAKSFQVPSQNLVYADTDGHIGYQAPGLIPIRNSGRGDWPVPGWDPKYHWKGYIPFDSLPSEFDPSDGVIVTANQAVVPPTYKYFLTDNWDYGYRSQQITDRIKAAGKLDANAMASIQLDTKNRVAEMLVPYLLRIGIDDSFDRQGQDTLRNWDFTQPADSAAAAYFNVVWRNILALTFHDQLPESTWPDGGSRWFEVIHTLLAQPNSKWWDKVGTPQLESRDDILREALVEGRSEITQKMAREPANWQWGKLHKLTLTNQTLGTSGIGVVERIFNRGPYELGGGTSLVDATSWDAAEGYTVTSTPSMRMVVDLADFDKSRWINLTGVSGHAFSSHYTDQTELWARGETLPWAYTKGAVEESRKDLLTFTKPER